MPNCRTSSRRSANRMLLAVERASIIKRITWHNFLHSLAKWLRWLGINVKTAQELLRHTNSHTTMDVYAHGVSSLKREANDNALTFVLLGKEKKTIEACRVFWTSGDQKLNVSD